jgi:long-chain acyl-CoA synthetase
VSSFLSIDKLSLHFAGVRALDGVSLSLDRGELFAVIGPNGAGKTSLFNCISGVYKPTSGTIRLGPRELTGRPSHDIASLGVARMFQNLALFENLTVLENLLIGRHHLYRTPFWRDILWFGRSRREEIDHRRSAEEIIEFLHLEKYRKIPVMILPYGVRKRVELGRALCMEPQLLLLDEPTAGLNQEETEDMARYLLDIKEELHITQILIEHELRFVLDLADRVAVLDFGKKIADGTPEHIRTHPAVIEAYIGGVRADADADDDDGEAGDSPDTTRSADSSPYRGSLGSGERGARKPRGDLADTLPARLDGHARDRGHKIAMREKDLGIWREITWGEYGANVRAAAHMLWELGVRPGDHVSILSGNCPEWLYSDLAAQSIGARGVGIYQTNPPSDVAYILNDSQSVVVFCEDQEQFDKVYEVAADTPSVKHVVVYDPRGTREVEDDRWVAWQDFLAQGEQLEADDPDWYDDQLATLDQDEPAMVVYTSGTTGHPKGAMLSARNVIEVSEQFNKTMGLGERDSVLSYLPLCHVAEKILSLFLPLTTGAVVHFGESIETVQADLREVSPSVFLGVPRIWEKMNASVVVKMKDSSFVKRHLYDYFAVKGREISERDLNGGRSLWDRIVWFVGDKLVFRPLQERLGLRNCKLPVSGAAPISADLLSWYHGLGVPVVEGYGMTESGGVSHINPPEAMKLGTVGKVLPLVECEVADDGEILVRGPNVFRGYLNKPEATSDSIDDEGWLHTGDVGAIDGDGYLTITGRKKEIIITSGGKNLSPEKIENALKTSPYVKEAVAIGDKRKFISALVQIELDSVGDWASRRKIAYTSYADLAAKPQVIELIDEEIRSSNELLARVEQVRKFRIIPKELNQDDGELTATQKVRRRAVHAAFETLIDDIYGGAAA